jgi:hypothetical protein
MICAGHSTRPPAIGEYIKQFLREMKTNPANQVLFARCWRRIDETRNAVHQQSNAKRASAIQPFLGMPSVCGAGPAPSALS